MNVVHFVTYDSYGAGRATIRINNAINNCGVESNVLVVDKRTSYKSINMCESFINLNRLKIYNKINSIYRDKTIIDGFLHFDSFGQSYSNINAIQKADVLNLHWVNEGIWSKHFLKYLKQLDKPIVWTLHDMWPFTGGCHYDEFCAQYKTGCKKCPKVVTNKQKKVCHELLFKEKKIRDLMVQPVGCSSWISKEFNESFLGIGGNIQCITINNPISESFFHVMDKDSCRRVLGIPLDKKVLAFGAIDATTEKRKGFDLLSKALNNLNTKKYIWLIFGSNQSGSIEHFETYSAGIVNDDMHLAMIYNAADCFVAPSLQENLANTVVESLSCGTPVVAFDIGGMPDMIDHLCTGYLATPYDYNDLARGIEKCADNKEIMTTKCVEFAKNNFNENLIGRKYIDLYIEMLKKKENGYKILFETD